MIFLIRTRRVPFFKSRPSLPMVVLPIVMATIGAVLPFTPLAHQLGFTTLPLGFFLILIGMVVAYLALIEFVKGRFYAHQDRPHPTPLSPQARHRRHQQRRAGRFGRPGIPASVGVAGR